MGWELLQHLLYSPDLGPSDFSFVPFHRNSLFCSQKSPKNHTKSIL